MRTIYTSALVAGAALLFAACADNPASGRDAADAEIAVPSQASLDKVFADAGAEFNVPASLLKAIGYHATELQMIRSEEEFPGQGRAYGVMALRGAQLARGASLAGVSIVAAQSDVRANVRAAAALLGAQAGELSIDRDDVGAWAPAVARYSGIASAEIRAMYVQNGVYGVLRNGAVARDESGAVTATIPQEMVKVDLGGTAAAIECAPDFCVSGALWRANPNYNARPAVPTNTSHPYKQQMIILHTCEGDYWNGCLQTLLDRGLSAHYVVSRPVDMADGSIQISQLVRESNRAWHIGAYYDAARNGGTHTYLNGVQSNDFTVGIEHAGYASQTTWSDTQLNFSARLSCDITKAYAIPRDRYHLKGHGELQSGKSDPGAAFWTYGVDYVVRVQNYCA